MPARLCLLVALAGVALAGCGSQAASPPDIAEAAAKTEAAASWRFEFFGAVRGLDDGDFAQRGHGEQDATNEAARVVFVDTGDPDFPTRETIHVGGKAYTRAGTGGGTDSWLALDDRSLEDLLPMGFLGNPLTTLDLLSATSRTIERTGEETVRGVRTVRSHAEVDALELARRTAKTKEERREIEAVFRTATSAAGIDVWIDDDGRVRKLAYALSLKERGAPEVAVNGWTEFFDFGSDVRIRAPKLPEPYKPKRDETLGACPGATAPHSVKAAAAAFRAHGFDPTARCAPEGTYLVDERDLSLFCAVHERPPAPGKVELPLVHGNIECDDKPGVRAALDSLR